MADKLCLYYIDACSKFNALAFLQYRNFIMKKTQEDEIKEVFFNRLDLARDRLHEVGLSIASGGLKAKKAKSFLQRSKNIIREET